MAVARVALACSGLHDEIAFAVDGQIEGGARRFQPPFAQSRTTPVSLTKLTVCGPLWPSEGWTCCDVFLELHRFALEAGVDMFARLFAITSIER